MPETKTASYIRRNGSLAARVIKHVFAIYIVLTTAVTVINMVVEYKYAKKDVIQDMLQVEKTFAPAMEEALWDLNNSQVRSNLHGITQLPSIVGIQLTDEYGTITQKLGTTGTPEKTGTEDDALLANVFSYTFQLSHQHPANPSKAEQPLGNATLYSDRSVVFDKVKLSYAFLIGNAIIKTIALWLLLSWVVKKLISQPLSRLTHQISDVDLDSLQHQQIDMGIRDRSELYALQNAFNNMLRTLHGSHSQLREFSRELEQKVRDRTLELRQERDKAEQATRTKSEFLANMSHEIRTPLNAITGMIHLAMQTDLTDKQRNYLEKSQTSSHILLRLINDILDVSKLEAGKLEIEQTDFYLSSIFVELADMFNPKAHEKGIEIAFYHPLPLQYKLIGDPLRLTQILINLVSNAVKFTAEGGIIVNCRVETQPDSRVTLLFSVRDTGIGMTQQQQSQLFQAFTQADTSTTRKFGGTGLGLVISRRLVEIMGGELHLQSKPGEGSEFCFDIQFKTIPLEANIVNPDELRGKRALIVDDSAIARDTLAMLLESFQFIVTTADCAEAGLAILEQSLESGDGSFDVVLMDWRMPGMDGLEASRMIKQDPRFQAIKALIMVTAYPNEKLMNEAKILGLSGFLLKPVPPSLLLETLSSALGQGILHTDRTPPLIRSSNREQLIGARVLLVDDNDLNRQVGCGLLEHVGIIVDCAENGQEAIEQVKTTTYDAVLMDIQMPIMDGYEATRIIRADHQFQNLPIIAMTANALLGDREKCLTAGMDEHIPKPIEPDYLYSTLCEFITGGNNSTFKPSKVETDETSLPATLAGIDIPTGLLYLNNNKAQYRKLLVQFRDKYAHADEDIAQQIQTGDRETAARTAHTLKGICGSLGAQQLQAQASALDATLTSNELDKALLICNTLFAKNLNTVIAGLKQLSDDKPSALEHIAKEQLITDLVKLKSLLKNGDFSVATYYAELRQGIIDHIGVDKGMLLEHQITTFNYEQAQRIVTEMQSEIS